jgi:small subunit ribosomal protein S9
MAQKLKKKNTKVQKVVKKIQPVSSSRQASKTTGQTNFTIPAVEYIEGIGRRKVATARVRIYPKPGDFVVNDRIVGDYFNTVRLAPALYNLPFQVTDTLGKFAVTVKVSGSGVNSQLAAVMHGIARALVKFNPDLKPLLKQADLLSRDDRMKETRKIGMGGKARRKRQSPKR